MAPALLAQVRLSPAVPPRRAARRPGRPAGAVHRPPALHVVAGARTNGWTGLADAAREQGVRRRRAHRRHRALPRRAAGEPRPPAAGARRRAGRRAAARGSTGTAGTASPPPRCPTGPPADESHRSRFGLGTLEDAGRDVEGSDGLIVLCAEDDSREAWLRAGEGLSALWLRAVRTGLSVVPLSQVVEVDETRAACATRCSAGSPYPCCSSGWAGRRSAAASWCRPLDVPWTACSLPAERPASSGPRARPASDSLL